VTLDRVLEDNTLAELVTTGKLSGEMMLLVTVMFVCRDDAGTPAICAVTQVCVCGMVGLDAASVRRRERDGSPRVRSAPGNAPLGRNPHRQTPGLPAHQRTTHQPTSTHNPMLPLPLRAGLLDAVPGLREEARQGGVRRGRSGDGVGDQVKGCRLLLPVCMHAACSTRPVSLLHTHISSILPVSLLQTHVCGVLSCPTAGAGTLSSRRCAQGVMPGQPNSSPPAQLTARDGLGLWASASLPA